MSFKFLKIENRLLETDLQTSAHSFFRNQFTTTKIFVVSVENLYFISAPASDTICTIQKMNGL
jgi:hypothetical protein